MLEGVVMSHCVAGRQRALRFCSVVTAVAAMAFIPLPALADEAPDLLTQPFYAALGSFILNSDTKVELDGQSQRGDKINWEDTFGGGNSTRFRIDAYWRFAEKHKVRALWFNSSRSNTRTLDRDIRWGDEVFPVNARTDGKFQFDIYELAYEYAFLRRENYELSATAGLHYAELAFS